MKKIICLLLTLYCFQFTHAQNNNAPSSFDIHDIKITGYLQAQYQRTQSPGAYTWSGGDFDESSESRFMIRRGRLKIDRVDKYSNIVFQIDGTQDGVRLMDAFIQFGMPSLPALKLTAGLFNRPFGYSIVYSSGYRDFPERARVFQTLMPRERDLGAMISYKPEGKFKFLTTELAVVNGSGLNAKDYDNKKDIIGNLYFKFDSIGQKPLHIGFGSSFYEGSVVSVESTVFHSQKGGYQKIDKASNKQDNFSRRYLGFNFQLELETGFGETTFKTEYIYGQQPGLAASVDINGPKASTSLGELPTGSLYLRPFEGYFIWLTQALGNSKFTAIAGLDMYDPNTDLNEKEIGLAQNYSTAGDVKFTTFGYGLTYNVNPRVKFTIYNEHVRNDATQLTTHLTDLKDDVFTARLQYRW
ncbi:MAG: porin [Pedobacter sp.]|nr:MAG: porin [Pedobacter sp.]